MGDRINNMSKMMNNQKQRNMYFLIVGAAIITLGAGIYISTKHSAGQQANSGASLAGAPNIDSTPGSSTNPQYNKSIAESNEKEAKKALEENKSFLPTLTSEELTNHSPLDDIEKEKQLADEEKMKQEDAKLAQLALEKQREDEESARKQALSSNTSNNYTNLQVVQNPVNEKHNKYGYDDALLISTLMGSTTFKESNSEFDYAKTRQNTQQQTVNVDTSIQGVQTTVNNDVPTKSFAKAGTIYNAVLETGINSDEPSPVLAKIVSGPLKGARLIGSIQTVGKKVLIQFTSMNVPSLDNSIAFNAYAIDSDTARTALASNVDNHYLLKYGVLFASSFLSGYAEALSRQNTTTTTSGLGTTTTQGPIPSKDIAKVALGNVGTAVSQSFGQEIQNMKPTITVNQGSPIGILLLSDLNVK